MRCYFLRHGIAVEPGEWKGRDFDRPLTDKGVERMEREARGIETLELELDAIFTSPLLRARQTAEIVAERLRMRDRLAEDARLGGDFSLDALRAILQEHRDANALLLVGHEPTFSLTIGRAIGNAAVEVKKGALAGIELAEPGSSTGLLISLIPPKALVALGKDRSR